MVEGHLFFSHQVDLRYRREEWLEKFRADMLEQSRGHYIALWAFDEHSIEHADYSEMICQNTLHLEALLFAREVEWLGWRPCNSEYSRRIVRLHPALRPSSICVCEFYQSIHGHRERKPLAACIQTLYLHRHYNQ